MKSGLTIDKVSLFSVRPPELCLLRTWKIISEFSDLKKIKTTVLREYLAVAVKLSSWVDGVSHLVR